MQEIFRLEICDAAVTVPSRLQHLFWCGAKEKVLLSSHAARAFVSGQVVKELQEPRMRQIAIV
jgi:hypothetical protein